MNISDSLFLSPNGQARFASNKATGVPWAFKVAIGEKPAAAS